MNSEPESGEKRSTGCRIAGGWSLQAATLLAGISPMLASAQTQTTELSIQSTVTATNNGALAPDGLERKDLLISVRPGLQFVRQGAGLQVRANVGADMAASARDTTRDRVLPQALVDAKATLVERLLFVDASADVRQVEDDPFGVRVGSGSSQNARTAGSYRLSPYVSYEVSPRTALLARYDGTWTRYAGTTLGDVTTRQGFVRLETKPQPIGAVLEWSAEDTDYADVSGSDLRVERLNATVNLAIDGEWVLGGVVGAERSEFASTRETDRLYGLRLYWSPGPRTEVAAGVDRRFFGNGWNLSARHRTPRMTFLIRMQQEPSTAASQAGGRALGGGLASFLDAILTTRQPDAAQRSGLVDSLVSTRGLQTSLQGAVGSSAPYAQLRTANELTWVYLNSRTTWSIAVYAQSLRQLARSDGIAVALGAASADSRQRGASLGWNRRLTPQTSLDTAATWSRIEGLALRDGDLTREAELRANLVRNLSPRTNMSAGLRLRHVTSSVVGVSSFDETAGFLGLAHRF